MVSKHVQSLEQLLGTRLFARTTRHLRLTEAGTAYLAGCRRVLADLAALEHAAGQFSDAPRGVLKVLAPTSFGSFQLAPVIADYAQRFPHVQVQLNLSDRPVGLMEEGVDVEIHIGALPDSSLVARRIAEVQLPSAARRPILHATACRLRSPISPGTTACATARAVARAHGSSAWMARTSRPACRAISRRRPATPCAWRRSAG